MIGLGFAYISMGQVVGAGDGQEILVRWEMKIKPSICKECSRLNIIMNVTVTKGNRWQGIELSKIM